MEAIPLPTVPTLEPLDTPTFSNDPLHPKISTNQTDPSGSKPTPPFSTGGPTISGTSLIPSSPGQSAMPASVQGSGLPAPSGTSAPPPTSGVLTSSGTPSVTPTPSQTPALPISSSSSGTSSSSKPASPGSSTIPSFSPTSGPTSSQTSGPASSQTSGSTSSQTSGPTSSTTSAIPAPSGVSPSVPISSGTSASPTLPGTPTVGPATPISPVTPTPTTLVTYTLSAEIDSSQYGFLKEKGYSLCIARKVNGAYTVVWSSQDILPINPYQWTEDYQIFTQDSFKVGAPVETPVTAAQDIQYGQTCVLEDDGTLDPATGDPDESGTFHFENRYGAIHVGVNAKLNGEYSPVFISPTIVSGYSDLSPTLDLLVWFDQNHKTGNMMFQDAVNSFEVTYAVGVESQTVEYGGDDPESGSWSLVTDSF